MGGRRPKRSAMDHRRGHSREIIQRGLELGGDFFDTAIAYQRGTSRQYLGRALRDFAKWGKMVGASKLHHMEGAAKAVDLTLTAEECAYVEELYTPHPLVGVMAQNTAAAAKADHVWSVGSQKV